MVLLLSGSIRAHKVRERQVVRDKRAQLLVPAYVPFQALVLNSRVRPTTLRRLCQQGEGSKQGYWSRRTNDAVKESTFYSTLNPHSNISAQKWNGATAHILVRQIPQTHTSLICWLKQFHMLL